MEIFAVDADDPRLDQFHRGVYWDAFAAQHEPLEAWQRALRGECAYELTVRVAMDGDAIAGGITYERYPRSNCGFLTYMVVTPAARGQRLGRRLLDEAIAELPDVVLGEVNDPELHGEEARARLERFRRWGARVADVRYVQPALGPGLQRDRGLRLISWANRLDGARLRTFVEELYAVTEGGPPDPEIAIAESVALL